MKARILQTYLNKTNHGEDEVTIALNNSEKEFHIIGVNQSQGKKIIVVELIEISDIQAGDSIESEKGPEKSEPKNTTVPEGTIVLSVQSMVEENKPVQEAYNALNDLAIRTTIENMGGMATNAGSGEVTKTQE